MENLRKIVSERKDSYFGCDVAFVRSVFWPILKKYRYAIVVTCAPRRSKHSKAWTNIHIVHTSRPIVWRVFFNADNDHLSFTQQNGLVPWIKQRRVANDQDTIVDFFKCSKSGVSKIKNKSSAEIARWRATLQAQGPGTSRTRNQVFCIFRVVNVSYFSSPFDYFLLGGRIL